MTSRPITPLAAVSALVIWTVAAAAVQAAGPLDGAWKITAPQSVDGVPMSADGRMIIRIRKVDNGDRRPLLEVINTIDDPTYYDRPWSMVRTWAWRPDKTVMREYNCEEQVGDPSVNPTQA